MALHHSPNRRRIRRYHQSRTRNRSPRIQARRTGGPANGAAVIPVLDEDNVRQGFLEQDQYERLLEELAANLKELFVCGYHTGARKNELRCIQWPQVDLDAGVIRLPASQTKTKKPRTLPIYGDMRRWRVCARRARRIASGSFAARATTP